MIYPFYLRIPFIIIFGFFTGGIYWIIGFILRLRYPNTNLTTSSCNTQKISPSSASQVEHHHIAGTSYHVNEIESLGVSNPDYELSKRELIENYSVGDRVYEYQFSACKTELIEEPDNEYDNNAVKVVLNDVHVGYIKKGSCLHIKKLLHSDKMICITSEIKGGKYKSLVSNYDDSKCDDTLSVERESLNYSIIVTIAIQ